MTLPSAIDVGVQPGEILAGKYRVERVLGAGGMGVVVAAHHIKLDEKVALKFLRPEALGNAEAVTRFEREARAAVKIKSENVARVIDVGTLPSGAPYMVMEYLEGGDLSGWLRQHGPLPVGQAVDFVLQACVAVADAHALGIVHRDLKPSNLFCVRRSDGQLSIKVLDFGISKVIDAGPTWGVSATKTNALMGSPLYMSPEQMRSSKDVDARTDIWALGVILFELLAGRPPFVSDSVTELAIKIATETPPGVCSFRHEVPVELEAIIGRCLEKEPDDRYRNVAELAVGLLPFAPPSAKTSVDRVAGIIRSAGLSRHPGDAAAAMSATAAFPNTFPPVGRSTGGATRSKKTALGAGLAGVLAVASIAALALWARGSVERVASPKADSHATTAAAQTLVAPPATAPLTAEVPAADATPTSLPEASSSAQAPPATTHRPARQGPPSMVASPPPPASVPPPPRPNCDPPYYYDKQGNRVFKSECPL